MNMISLLNISLFPVKRMMTGDGLNFSFILIYLDFTTCLEILISFSIMVSLDEELCS